MCFFFKVGTAGENTTTIFYIKVKECTRYLQGLLEVQSGDIQIKNKKIFTLALATNH
jgi:hypothetical protein